ncbi:MAG TPA: hypothetical protein VHQ01_12640, partial [Pyrinomonadaceae bacterium]|nr:hypothetical protein [Pyrinomonadaceae bacterium]
MRLEFEPNVTAFPLVENEMFDELTVASDFQTILKNGIAAAQSGDREHARTLLVKAAAYEPRSEDAWMWLASISEYPEELLAFLNNVLNINPENERALEWRTATKALLAKTLVQRGVSAHNEGNATLAAQCFDQALVHDNDCEMAWFWKASLAPDDEQQVEFLNKVLSLNPENLDAQNALEMIMKARAQSTVDDAKAAAVAGDSSLALELLDRALAAAPDNVDAWVLRSHLSTVIQDKLDALAKVLELDPENAAARTSYDFLASTAKPAEAVKPEAQAEVTVEAEENVEAAAVEADLAAETVEDHEVESQVEPVVDSKTEDLAFALAVTEDHEVEPSTEPSHDAELDAGDYAYTQTVTFKADAVTEDVEEPALLEVGFISAATLGQKDLAEADPIHITEEPVESARPVEELFGPVEDQVDADRETVESISPWDELAEPAAAEETEDISAAQT